MAHKTKATRYGGPSTQATRYPQRMSIANNATFAAGGQSVRFTPMTLGLTEGHYGECAGLLVGYSCSLALLRNRAVSACFLASSASLATSSGERSSDALSILARPSLTVIFLGSSIITCASLWLLLIKAVTEQSVTEKKFRLGYSCSLAFRRWRRLISPCIDAMMNCDVLSPDSFTDSMAFTISCGTRAFRACDFAFVVPVAISIPLLDWWGTVYTEKAQIKPLTWTTPKAYSGPHLEIIKVHKCKAPQVSLPLAGLLTTNDSNSIEVAMLNHTTHPQGRDSHDLNKYIWRFIALSTAQPRVIHIVATSEQEARQQSPDGCVMVFAARIRQEVRHVQ
ncbi:host cell division inhibitor Icd-like protein [Escherichia coli]|nr:host cell division inhibitor Icd-like protein [Escherichia coli]